MTLDSKTTLQLSGKKISKTERNFIAAWIWVKENYPELYKLPSKITANVSGAAIRASYNEKENRIWVNMKENSIYKTPCLFASSLVHELTHAHQVLVQKRTRIPFYKTKKDYENDPMEIDSRKAGEKTWNEWQRKPLLWENINPEQMKGFKL